MAVVDVAGDDVVGDEVALEHGDENSDEGGGISGISGRVGGGVTGRLISL